MQWNRSYYYLLFVSPGFKWNKFEADREVDEVKIQVLETQVTASTLNYNYAKLHSFYLMLSAFLHPKNFWGLFAYIGEKAYLYENLNT